MSKKRKSNFRGKVTKDAERQKRARASYGYLNLPKDVKTFSPDPGSRVQLDFLPYEVTDKNHPDRNEEAEIAVPESLWYKRPFKIHRNIGAENEAVVCPAFIGEKCPICKERSRMIKKGEDKEDIDSLKQSLRNLYVVIPFDSKKYEEKPHIFDISQYCFQKLLNEELEEDDDNARFPDLEEGLTLKIRFESKTIGKSEPFPDASRIDFLERDSEYGEKILDEVPNLDEVLNILSYKELEAKFFEMEDEDTDNDKVVDPDEDDEPKRSHRRRKEEKSDPKDEQEKKEKREEKDKPTRRTRREHKETSENECPHGHKFGTDCEKYDECDECDKWDECIEENEKQE